MPDSACRAGYAQTQHGRACTVTAVPLRRVERPYGCSLLKLANDVRRLDVICAFFLYRLDQILGKVGSKAKDVYESKISLASRIVKVERAVSESLLITDVW